MRIIQLVIENYKKIKTVILDLDGKNLQVAGDTGTGKSTAISAFWDLLKTTGEPIQKGKNNAKIRVVLGNDKPEIIAERRYTKASSSISITTADSKKKVSSKDFRDWFCSLAVNPHKIIDQGPAEQLRTLMESVRFPDNFNLVAHDSAMANMEETISTVKNNLKFLKEAQGAEPEKVEKVDLFELHAQLRKVEDDNKIIEDTEQGIEKAKQAILEYEQKIRDGKAYLDQAEDWLKLQIKVDTSEIVEKISKAGAINEKAQKYEDWVKEEEKVQKLEGERQTKERALKSLKNEKKDAMEKAYWPIPGLSIEDSKVYYKGILLSALGESEQMLVCGALAIKQINESPLKIVRMDGVESMSKKDFAELSKIFNDAGIQVLSSRVSRGEIEDGEIEIVEGEAKSVK